MSKFDARACEGRAIAVAMSRMVAATLSHRRLANGEQQQVELP
jgi:hypothetical protein